MAACDATAVLKSAEKFHVFHQRDFRKSANVNEDRSPAEYPVVATSHPQQNPGVVCKTISPPVNQVLRQANSKKTACDSRIIHDVLDLLQTAPRNFGIDMDKPKGVAVCGARTGIHLYRPIAFTHDKLVARAENKFNRAIRASTICNDNLCARCPLAQMREK
jgi:hypothetical protein